MSATEHCVGGYGRLMCSRAMDRRKGVRHAACRARRMRTELVIRSILQTTATKSERPRQCWQAAHTPNRFDSSSVTYLLQLGNLQIGAAATKALTCLCPAAVGRARRGGHYFTFATLLATAANVAGWKSTTASRSISSSSAAEARPRSAHSKADMSTTWRGLPVQLRTAGLRSSTWRRHRWPLSPRGRPARAP